MEMHDGGVTYRILAARKRQGGAYRLVARSMHEANKSNAGSGKLVEIERIAE